MEALKDFSTYYNTWLNNFRNFKFLWNFSSYYDLAKEFSH